MTVTCGAAGAAAKKRSYDGGAVGAAERKINTDSGAAGAAGGKRTGQQPKHARRVNVEDCVIP